MCVRSNDDDDDSEPCIPGNPAVGTWKPKYDFHPSSRPVVVVTPGNQDTE